jgi:gliding motility-associated lipoprotein GldH
MIVKSKNRILVLLLTAISVAFSCTHNTFYQKSDSMPNEIWHKDSALVYRITISDSSQFYNFYFDIRNTVSYPYQNLFIFFTSQFPDSTMFTDTLNCNLFDAYGRWTGSGSGRIKENRFTFKSKVCFPQTGDYIFTSQHAMRDTHLIGISNFGITLQYE